MSHATDFMGFKFLTAEAADVARMVRSGQRLVARSQARIMLELYKAGVLTEDDVLGSLEVSVHGSCADLRTYHRIPIYPPHPTSRPPVHEGSERVVFPPGTPIEAWPRA